MYLALKASCSYHSFDLINSNYSLLFWYMHIGRSDIQNSYTLHRRRSRDAKFWVSNLQPTKKQELYWAEKQQQKRWVFSDVWYVMKGLLIYYCQVESRHRPKRKRNNSLKIPGGTQQSLMLEDSSLRSSPFDLFTIIFDRYVRYIVTSFVHLLLTNECLYGTLFRMLHLWFHPL